MWAHVIGGKVKQVYEQPRSWAHGEFQHPALLMETGTFEELNLLGIYEYVKIERPDQDFYEVGNLTYVVDEKKKTVTEIYGSTVRDIKEARAVVKAKIEALAYKLLKEDDWKVIRATEYLLLPENEKPNFTKPEFDISLHNNRKNIRNAIETHSTAIDALTTVEEIINYQWPDSLVTS